MPNDLALYALPVSKVEDEFLKDSNSETLAYTRPPKSKMLSRLLPPSNPWTKRYYKLEGDVTFPDSDFPSAAGNLNDGWQLSSTVRPDSTLASFKMEDFKVTIKPLVEASSWMDWRLITI